VRRGPDRLAEFLVQSDTARGVEEAEAASEDQLGSFLPFSSFFKFRTFHTTHAISISFFCFSSEQGDAL
jgi:hypothetical protein